MRNYNLMEYEVAPEDIEGSVVRLNEFLEPYLPLFGRVEPQGHALTYVMGRTEPLDRRTIEPIATQHGVPVQLKRDS